MRVGKQKLCGISLAWLSVAAAWCRSHVCEGIVTSREWKQTKGKLKSRAKKREIPARASEKHTGGLCVFVLIKKTSCLQVLERL